METVYQVLQSGTVAILESPSESKMLCALDLADRMAAGTVGAVLRAAVEPPSRVMRVGLAHESHESMPVLTIILARENRSV